MAAFPPDEWVDRVVDLLARAMDALGLNGRRLRWKWNQRRQRIAEDAVRSEVLLRSAKGRHKMCPHCRALVPRGARTCPECEGGLAGVRAPGLGRLLANLLPGASAPTALILLVNGFWFLVMMLAQVKSGSSSGGGLFAGFSGELIVRFGSGYSPYTLSGEWWRLVTPVFLHAGILHFFFNSYLLVNLGPVTEEEFGRERFWVIYLACGIVGAALSQFARPVNTLGASGALMGLVGLLLAYGWRQGGALGTTLKRSMLRFLAYMLIFSVLVRGIDHWNHAGGFICGALVGLQIRGVRTLSRGKAAFWQALALAGVLLVAIAFLLVALHGGT